MKHLHPLLLLLLLSASSLMSSEWVTYEGNVGPGKGKHIVFLSGDEEYRSEEALPMLAKILAVRHGFKCTVLFPIDPETGVINPDNQTNIVGMSQLATADLVVMLLRFRELPDSEMKHFVNYLNSGKPIIALRTSTHAFSYERNKKSPYYRYDWRNKEWPGGFGQQVLGDTWISHHGNHGSESTRGIITPEFKMHPVARGVDDLWGPTDVYGIAHLPSDAQVWVQGQVVAGMKPTDPALDGPKNHPMMPVIWTRTHRGEEGRSTQIVCSTFASAPDFKNEGLRRLMVNASYWLLGMQDKIPAKSDVSYVGEYQPNFFGFGKQKKGIKPSDHELR